ncbi:MAG: Di-glucose binding within endoplasmic reticulum [Phycisphaerales bacterium]|nr:Di-glucose binding within endoplasmic reticulum [Phycisphaerales bacterium]
MLARIVLLVLGIVVVGLVLFGVGLATGFMHVGGEGITFGHAANEVAAGGPPKPPTVSADDLLRQAGVNPETAGKPPIAAPVTPPKESPKPSMAQAVPQSNLVPQQPAAQKPADLSGPQKVDTHQASEIRPASADVPIIRVSAGSTAAIRDSRGNTWQPDSNFDGGEIVDRGPIAIANTDKPGVYRTEHYVMTGWHKDLPNGRYAVNLHFAETCPYINGPGQRVFHMNVQGIDCRDFDVFKEAGGRDRALIKTFHVAVTDGRLAIRFQQTDKNAPEINGVEVLPE